MKRGAWGSVVIGVMLSVFPAVGAVASQTDRLDVPEVAEVDLKWEPIPIEITGEHDADPVLIEEEVEVIGAEPEPMIVHTHSADVITDRWVVLYGHPNDENIPDEVEEPAELFGRLYGICPELLESIAYEESRYIPTVIDESGTCVGLMQLNILSQGGRMEDFGFDKDDLMEPDKNMLIAAQYLSELFADYGDVGEVLLRFNGASSALKKYKATGQLSGYATRILERSEALERAHGK